MQNYEYIDGMLKKIPSTDLANCSCIQGETVNDALDTLYDSDFDASRDPTGFEGTQDASLSFDDGTRTLTVSPANSEFTIWVRGKFYTKTSAATFQISDVDGLHAIYYDVDGDITEVVDPNTGFLDQIIRGVYDGGSALIAYVYWDTVASQGVYVARETHNAQMDGSSHAYNHFTRGAQFVNGLALGVNTSGNGDDEEDAQISVENGMITDEDLPTMIMDGLPQELNPIAEIPVFFYENSKWNKSTTTLFPVKSFVGGSGRLAWNDVSGTGTQIEVDNNDFVLAHIFATNDILNPMVAIQGQNEYNTRGAAREGATTEISNLLTGDLLFEEFVPIGTIIYQTGNGYDNTVKARTQTTDTGDDYVDWRFQELNATSGISDHGNLNGLNNDDHTQYVIGDGSRKSTSVLTASISSDAYNVGASAGVSGNFTSSDGKTITVSNGIIIGIV